MAQPLVHSFSNKGDGLSRLPLAAVSGVGEVYMEAGRSESVIVRFYLSVTPGIPPRICTAIVTAICIAVPSLTRLAMPLLMIDETGKHDGRMSAMYAVFQSHYVHSSPTRNRKRKSERPLIFFSEQREKAHAHSPCCRFRRWRSIWKAA